MYVGRRDNGVKDEYIFRLDYLFESVSLSMGDMFPDPQGMPGTVTRTEPCMYHVFSYTYMPADGLLVYHLTRICINWAQ